MAIKFNLKNGDMKINDIEVWNDEGVGKIGLKADKLDEFHADELNKKAYRIEIISSNGNMFRTNQVDTTLIAKVYQGPDDITDTISPVRFIWSRVSQAGEAIDDMWNQSHQGIGNILKVNANDSFGRTTFNCQLIDIVIT
jgi:hypothetical protein